MIAHSGFSETSYQGNCESRITLSWAPGSIKVRPLVSWVSIDLFVCLGILLVLASSADAADGTDSMPASLDLELDASPPPQAISTFSMMAAMALQSSLDGASTQSNWRSSIRDVVSITPRVWITQVNLTESENFDSGAVIVPMYGGSITITPPNFKNFSLLATGFYGTGKGEAFGRDPDVQEGDSKIERADIEVLLRYRIPETQLIVFGGPRYVSFDQSFEFSSFDVDQKSKIWVIEAGIGAFANLTDNGRHRFFGNLTIGAAFEAFESKSEQEGVFVGKENQTTASVDLNLGYEYLLADWVDLNVRYRMFTIFTEDDFVQDDLTTIHGPELGLAFRF